jgi:hypothetical protein
MVMTFYSSEKITVNFDNNFIHLNDEVRLMIAMTMS